MPRESGVKRAARAAIALGAAWALAAPAAAQGPDLGVGAYLTLATDARRRGLSQVQDEAAASAGLDYQHASGFFVGGRLGNVSYEPYRGASRGDSRDLLLELYAGWLWRGSALGFTGSIGSYRYPGAAYDYDYTEISAVVDFRDRWYYGFTYAEASRSGIYAPVTHEIGMSRPLPGGLELGTAIGRVRTRSARTLDYTHYNIGISKLVGSFGLDLRRYETSRDIHSAYGTSEADRWVLSLSYALRPRP